jgi:hypothetical protein
MGFQSVLKRLVEVKPDQSVKYLTNRAAPSQPQFVFEQKPFRRIAKLQFDICRQSDTGLYHLRDNSIGAVCDRGYGPAGQSMFVPQALVNIDHIAEVRFIAGLYDVILKMLPRPPPVIFLVSRVYHKIVELFRGGIGDCQTNDMLNHALYLSFIIIQLQDRSLLFSESIPAVFLLSAFE